MATFTTTQPGASADYMKYVYNGLVKDDRTNDPKLLDFGLVPWDNSFVKLTRGAYITLTNSTYGTWFTGFITNDPELDYIGTKGGVPVHGFVYEATSDEYLLNLKNIGIVPPFINTNQGTILKYLVSILTPAGYTFDVSNIANGQNIPRYVIDPTKKFSDVVKEFADAANYRFWAIGMKLYFVQRDSVACAITIDGNNKHFTPSNLKLAPTSDAIYNDVVVTGQIEPQNFINEYFVGDGYTGQIATMAGVFGADNSLLLDDDFSASQIDNTKWTIFDKPANYLQPLNGFLNVLGGSQTFDVYLQSANLVPLEGNLRITHGEYDFVNSASRGVNGVIGGLWTGTPAQTDNNTYPGCVYGIRVFNQTNLVPDSDNLSGTTYWSYSDGSISTVAGAAVRGNGFKYTGTGTAAGFHWAQSAIITVQPNTTYTISGWIDGSHVTAGGPNWCVFDPALTTNYCSATQTAGVNNRVSNSFTTGAGVTQVRVLFDTSNCTVANGQLLTASNPQLELGSAVTTYETNNTGTMDTRLMPVCGSTLDRTQTLPIDFTKRYILRTLMHVNQLHRFSRQYSYIDSNGNIGGFGGAGIADVATFQTYITEIDPSNANITNQWVWTNAAISLSNAQTFAYYDPVVSNDLHCTLTGITVSTPLQVSLETQKKGTSFFVKQLVGPNEIDSFDGLAPVATVTDANNGVTTKSSLLGTSQYNPGQAMLQFFHDTTKQTSQIPQPGDIVHFSYRKPGAAIARVQDKTSIAAEAAAWGDNGLRSITKGQLFPAPRNSAECEWAAASVVKYTNYQHYQGSYTIQNSPFTSSIFTGEPLSGTILKFQNMPSQFPSYLKAEIVSQVKTTFDHSVGGECFTHSISFGPIDPALAAQARMRRMDDVFNPQDSVEVPQYIDVSSVGLAFAPDVVAPTLVSVDANNCNFNTNQQTLNPNLNLQTALMGNISPWYSNNATSITSNSTDFAGPGGLPVTKFVCSGGSDPYVGQQINLGVPLVGNTFTASVWVLGTGATIGKQCGLFMFDGPVVEVYSQNFTLTGEWQRIKITYTFTSSTSTSVSFRVDPVNAVPYAAGDTVYIAGPQMQFGAVATDFIANGSSIAQINGFEVRYTDESWGCDAGKNLVTRVSGQTFSVPRNNRGKVCFVKSYDKRNKIPYSEDLTQTNWTQDGVTVANSTLLNPDNQYSQISTVTPVSGNKRIYCYTGIAPSLLPVYAGVWVKGTAGDSIAIHISNNVTQDFVSTLTLNGKWQRLSVANTFSSAGSTSSATVATNLLITINLLGTHPVQITRVNCELNTLTETVYCKTNGSAYGATSRFASGLKVGFPLIPPAPTATIDATNPVLPVLNVVMPSALTDVWGIEIRASDNSTVIKHIDLTDASFVTTWAMPTNASRSLSYYVYTYNLLGEYSTAYNATLTIPTPAITSLAVDDNSASIYWAATNTQNVTAYKLELNPGSSYNAADPSYLANTIGPGGSFGVLQGSSFFNQWHFRLTPLDALGAGTFMETTHSYTPTGVVAFGAGQVAVIPAPATPTTDPVVPPALSDYPRDVIDEGWGNYKNNRLRYF